MKTTASGIAFFVTLWCIQLTGVPAVGNTASFSQSSYCTGVYACLSEKPRSCSSELCRAETGITYDSDFCAVFHELYDRGLQHDSPRGRHIYSLLSKKHRITYEIKGTLPIAAPVLGYLMEHIPFAAQLVNAYEGTSYKARYLDKKRKRFHGTNGDTVSGVFSIVLQNSDQSETVYFGTGTTRLLMWQLWGTGLVFFDYTPVQSEQISYRVRCMVFPGNSFVTSIMKFILFRKLVNGILRDMITAIHRATREFAAGNRKPLESHQGFTTDEGKKRIRSFERIVLENTGG